MPLILKKDKKVDVSFTNWVLGGSLLSISTIDNEIKGQQKRTSSRKVTITEVDSDDNEIVVKKSKDKGEKVDKTIDVSNLIVDEKDKRDKKAKENGIDGEKQPIKCSECGYEKEHAPAKESAPAKEPDATPAATESKTDGGNKHEGGESQGWTEQQDSKIKDMKSANKSWKEIAAAVGASKKDVQSRFKELQNHEEKATSGNANGAGDNDGGNEGYGDLGGVFGDDFGNAPDSNEQNQNCQDHGNKGYSRGRDPGHHSGNFSNERGNNQDERSHGGAMGRLQPDGVWTRDDCEILEYLESKYEEHKWLHMQAGFFNWTGRMVVAELIEKKFRGDGAI